MNSSLLTFITRLKSLKLSLGLLLVLLPLIVLGNILPQEGRLHPSEMLAWQLDHPILSKFCSAIGLFHIYTSLWFLLLTILLFTNLLLTTCDLYKSTWRKAQGLHRYSDSGLAMHVLAHIRLGPDCLATIATALQKRRYRITRVGGELYARKAWAGIWGGTILHIGLAVIVLGGLISGFTRFTGFLELASGQKVSETPSSYLQFRKGLFFPGNRPELTIGVEDIRVEAKGRKRTVISRVQIDEHGAHVLTKSIRMNNPLRYKDLTIYQSNAAGPALLFAFVNDIGMDIGYVHLPSHNFPQETSFAIPGTSAKAKIEMHAPPASPSITIEDNGIPIFSGPVTLGQTVDIGPLGKLRLMAIKKWTGLIVVYDYAVPIIFLGFFLAVSGVVLLTLLDPREIWIRADPSRDDAFVVLGWGRWKNMLREEVSNVIMAESA